MITGSASSSTNVIAIEQELDERFVTYILEIEKRSSSQSESY
jgi:hypothetical protein